MKYILIFLLSLMLLEVQAEDVAEQKPSSATMPLVSDMWLRAAPPTARMLAAYITLDNQTNQDLTLVGAYAPDFGVAEIHRTLEVDGTLKMQQQKALDLPQQTSITMQPGGLHIMLMMPKKSFKVGEEARICLIYQDDKGNELIQHLDFPVAKK